MKRINGFEILLLFLLVFPQGVVQAVMTSTNYEIRNEAVGFGGSDTGSSSSYELRSTVGPAVESTNSSSYRVGNGYRHNVIDRIATFSVYMQNNSTQVAASSLSGSDVTVTNASGFSSGDMLAVVQDEGVSQVTAIGKVSSIAGSVISIDFLSDGGTAPSIDGSSDYVYNLDGSSLSLGSLNTSSVATTVVAWDVTALLDGGFDVYVAEDRNLATSADEGTVLADVIDGTVTAGSEEYGGRSSDISLTGSTFDTEDAAFTTALQQVADRTSGDAKARDFLTVKAAISTGTDTGTYSHTLSLVYVGDY